MAFDPNAFLSGSAPINPSSLPTVTGAPSFGSTTISGSLGNTKQQGSNVTNQTGQARSQFLPEQGSLQNQILQALGGFVSGQSGAPSYFTAPPQVFQAYNDAFNKFVKPGIAAQFGAGSPQIGSQQSFGNEQLAAQLYQSGLGNYLQALGLGGGLAFNPVGQNTGQQGQQVENVNTNQSTLSGSNTTYGQSLLSLLLNGLGP